MRGRKHPSRWAWPVRFLTAFAIVATLAFGADAPGYYKGLAPWWLRALWTGGASASGGGTLGPFHYIAGSPYFARKIDGVPLRCREYVGPGHVYVVCVVRKAAAKAPKA